MKRVIPAAAAALLLTACGGTAPAVQDAQPKTEAAAGEPSSEARLDDLDALEGEPGGPLEMETWKASDGPADWACYGDTGTTYKVKLPADGSTEAAQKFESMRDKLGIEQEYSYITVDVDATQAQEAKYPISLDWATTDQTSQTAVTPIEATAGWDSNIPEDDSSLYNEWVDFYNEYIIDEAPNRGAKGEVLMMIDAPVDSVVALEMVEGGMSPAFCTMES